MDEVSAIISTLHTGSKNWLQPKKLGCRRRAVIRTEFEGDVANFMSLVGGFVRLFQLSCCWPLHCTGAGRYEGCLASARHAEGRGSQFSSSSVQCCVPARPLPEGLCRASRFRSRACPSPQPQKNSDGQNVGIWSAGRSERRRRASCPRRTQRSARQTCTSRFGRGPCHGLQTFRVSAEKDWVCMKMSFSPESDHAGRTTFSRPTKIE